MESWFRIWDDLANTKNRALFSPKPTIVPGRYGQPYRRIKNLTNKTEIFQWDYSTSLRRKKANSRWIILL
tara:strand:- start:22603 stop:22812 length:210 start_codon:yes stop_codon:yes gene_type:complete